MTCHASQIVDMGHNPGPTVAHLEKSVLGIAAVDLEDRSCRRMLVTL